MCSIFVKKSLMPKGYDDQWCETRFVLSSSCIKGFSKEVLRYPNQSRTRPRLFTLTIDDMSGIQCRLIATACGFTRNLTSWRATV